MKTKKTTVFILFMFCLYGIYSQTKIKDLNFLKGTWQVENKNQYESWQTDSLNQLKGNSYTIKDNSKKYLETLSIRQIKEQIVYEAIVPNQNEGKAVPFILNAEIKDWVSFENLKHDFPKKIRYKKLNDKELFVEVLGDNDKGFSYKMIRAIDK